MGVGVQNRVLATDMINSLTKLGVPVVNGGKMNDKLCQRKGESYYLGYYSAAHNYIAICTNVANKDQQFETLTHEVVHVIQDARDGMNNIELKAESARLTPSSEYNPVIENMTHDKYNLVRELYPAAHWAAEFEAFHYQDQPVVVANALRTFTF